MQVLQKKKGCKMSFMKEEKGNAESLIKEYESLKNAVAELTTRKSNIQNEIDKATKEATVALEAVYAKKLQDLEATYKSKFAQLETERASVDNFNTILKATDAELVKKAAELIDISDEQQEIIKRNIVDSEQNSKDKEANEKYILENKTEFTQREVVLAQQMDKLKERQAQLDGIELRLKEEAGNNASSKLELEKDKKALDSLMNELTARENTIIEKEKQADVAIKESVALKSQAEQDTAFAKDMLSQAEKYRSELVQAQKEAEALKNDLDKKATSLENWQTDLKIIEKALNQQKQELIFMEKKIKEAKAAIT